MNKEKLLKMLKTKQDQRTKLNKELIESDNKELRAEIGSTLEALAEEIEDIKALIAELEEPAESDEPAANEESGERGLNILATMQTRSNKPAKVTDAYDTIEYRTAFMNFCKNGTAIPYNLRANEVTKTTDASAVIPTTIVNEIVSELKAYGSLYAAVRKLNVQGGVKIPILSLKPEAKWITADTGTAESDTQKLVANTAIEFSYYGLECKVSQTLLTNVTTIEAFQALFVELAVEAIAKAFDIAIINGTGSGEPMGVAVDTRVPTANVITLSADDVASWSAWKKKVFGKMKKSYRNGTFFMAQSTFDGYIDGMVDSTGQPIGRVNYGIDGGETYRFGGKTVETVEEDIIKSYDAATTGEVFAVFFNPKDYAINSNLEMTTVRWVDHDTNEIKNKVILIADGKLIDAYGVLVIKKA